MKVVLSLAFEDGDDQERDYTLHFVNGETVGLSHAVSQTVVPIEQFEEPGEGDAT